MLSIFCTGPRVCEEITYLVFYVVLREDLPRSPANLRSGFSLNVTSTAEGDDHIQNNVAPATRVKPLTEASHLR